MADEAKTERIRRAPGNGAHEEPYLIVLAGGPAGMMYKLRFDTAMVIGRGLHADIRLEDEGVSRRHVQVTASRDGNPVLEDLGSSNGTFVNGIQIQRQQLEDGDKIQIGSISILKFSYQDDLERSFQQKLFDRGTKDGLTEIYNKKFFLDQLASEYAHARRHNRDLSLLFFDVDHFKSINDMYGHPAADFILRELARVARETLRTEDLLARYGGDEFVVVMRDIDDAGTLVLAQRIHSVVESHQFIFDGVEIPLTISLGVASLSATMNDANELVQLADKYLYEAKEAGRNRVGGRAVKIATQSTRDFPTVRKRSGKA
ncbi:MAG: GGDEF domain-containing protein [Gammaproteobacteria bacterium]|nr:GGDEF domain-containing protein [Gammaproteobacteria bacterium]